MLLDTELVFVVVEQGMGTNSQQVEQAQRKRYMVPQTFTIPWRYVLGQGRAGCTMGCVLEETAWLGGGPEHPSTLENPDLCSQGYSLAGM